MLSKKHDPDMPRVPLWKKNEFDGGRSRRILRNKAYLKLKKFQVKKTVPLSYGMEQSG